MPTPRKPRNDAGALASNYAKPMRWKIDADFLSKLSPTERSWYAAFLDAHYGGDFRGQPEQWGTESRRKAWSEQRATRKDAHTLATLGGGPDEIPPDAHTDEGAVKDWAVTPGYLDDPEYKAAREAYRKELGQQRRLTVPQETPEYLRAKRVLAVVTPTAPAPIPTPRRKRKPQHV